MDISTPKNSISKFVQSAASGLSGAAAIEAFIKQTPMRAGVYRMLDEEGKVLYVGKAKQLPKRLQYYTQPEKLPPRLASMVAQTTALEIITTESETEALLLEANLIKNLKPRYNILLRDDKSFPYILIGEDHPYPQLIKHRGNRAKKGHYFGPFASIADVNEVMTQLQRMFFLRPCTDPYFASRKRPCLEYEIKRCSAPCVGYVTTEEYQEQIAQACAFLRGKSTQLQQRLSKLMQAASDNMDFERAALYRDRIRALTHIQARQLINFADIEEADVIGVFYDESLDLYSIQVFFIRAGHHNGNVSYFPEQTEAMKREEVLTAFLLQFYQRHECPALILVSCMLPEMQELQKALSKLSGKKVKIHHPKLGDKYELTQRATENAKEALKRHASTMLAKEYVLRAFMERFQLAKFPKRIEVFDNSHLMGTHPVGAMVVATPEGFQKSSYRRFNVAKQFQDRPPTGGDDYAMLYEVLTRRLKRLLADTPTYVPTEWPDVWLIDGGKGQLSVAEAVCKEFNIESIHLIAISKGPQRNAGCEQFWQPGQAPFTLPRDDMVMRYLQQLRNEAHRYAITSHQKKRKIAFISSQLDEVPQIGVKRKKALLHYFGSVKAIADASIEDLIKVEGIHEAAAKSIFDFFHPNRESR